MPLLGVIIVGPSFDQGRLGALTEIIGLQRKARGLPRYQPRSEIMVQSVVVDSLRPSSTLRFPPLVLMCFTSKKELLAGNGAMDDGEAADLEMDTFLCATSIHLGGQPALYPGSSNRRCPDQAGLYHCLQVCLMDIKIARRQSGWPLKLRASRG